MGFYTEKMQPGIKFGRTSPGEADGALDYHSENFQSAASRDAATIGGAGEDMPTSMKKAVSNLNMKRFSGPQSLRYIQGIDLTTSPGDGIPENNSGQRGIGYGSNSSV